MPPSVKRWCGVRGVACACGFVLVCACHLYTYVRPADAFRYVGLTETVGGRVAPLCCNRVVAALGWFVRRWLLAIGIAARTSMGIRRRLHVVRCAGESLQRYQLTWITSHGHTGD